MRSAMALGALAGALLVSLGPGEAKAEAGVRHKHGKAPVEGVLNINRASEAELELLPGIGKGRAATIVARRQVRPFASLDDVARIKGLRKLVGRLRAHLTVDGPTTLRPLARPAKTEVALPPAQAGPH